MTKEEKEKKTKNYILSNNVVINLAGLVSSRKSNKQKSSSSEKEDKAKQQENVTPARFTNISNLETQIQQANLRTAENRFNNTTSPIIEREIKTEDRFREGTRYYNPLDNAGAFGAIQGSDGFIPQGNNIPTTDYYDDSNSIMSDLTADANSANDMIADDLNSNVPSSYRSINSNTDFTFGPPSKSSTDNKSTSSESLIMTEGRLLQRGRTYTRDEVQLWLENNKRINPRRPLKRPATDGRRYALIDRKGDMFRTLFDDAVAYGMF